MENRLEAIESKLDELLLNLDRIKAQDRRYIDAKEVGEILNLDHRTVLNRSNLDPENLRFIPSLKLRGSRKKYFDRRVIQRLFSVR